MSWLRTINESWLDTVEGNAPLLLTFTHAGSKRIPGIKLADSTGTKRQDPGAIGCKFNAGSTHDTRTRELAESILEYLDWHCDITPYMVIPHVSRRDLDLNRSWEHNRKGYELGNVDQKVINIANKYYDDYYQAINTHIAAIQGRFDATVSARSFHFDFHGIGLDANIDIELGTLEGKAADKPLVYGGAGVELAVIDALKNQGFRFKNNSATNNALEGCEVLAQAGLENNGLQSVQLEFSQESRGSVGDTQDDKIKIARQTGRKVGIAFGELIKRNSYPVINPDAAPSDDDEHFVSLFY